jgi:hypothetical protein
MTISFGFTVLRRVVYVEWDQNNLWKRLPTWQDAQPGLELFWARLAIQVCPCGVPHNPKT